MCVLYTKMPYKQNTYQKSDTPQNLISFRFFKSNHVLKIGGYHCMRLVCGTPTRFMAAPNTARTAQAMTITPAIRAWVKNWRDLIYWQFCYLLLNVSAAQWPFCMNRTSCKG